MDRYAMPFGPAHSVNHPLLGATDKDESGKYRQWTSSFVVIEKGLWDKCAVNFSKEDFLLKAVETRIHTKHTAEAYINQKWTYFFFPVLGSKLAKVGFIN
jgi:hypothetical protein